MEKIQRPGVENLDGPVLAAAIKADFGLELSEVVKRQVGVVNHVCSARLGDEIVYIRISRDSRTFDSESVAYDTLRDHGLPVPKVIAYKQNPSTIKAPTIILSAAGGVPIMDVVVSPEEKDIIHTKLGKFLKKMHAIKIPGFGKVQSGKDGLEGTSKTWKDYWDTRDKFQERINFLLAQNLITNEQAEKIRVISEEIGNIDLPEASFLHRDINDANIFIQGTDISGVIDLDGVLAGDPRFDIAISLLYHYDERSQECIKKGYGELAYDPFVKKYLLIAAVEKIHSRMIKRKVSPGNAVKILLETLEEIK